MNDIIINCKKCEDNCVIGYLSDYLDSEEIQQLDTYDFKQPLPQRLKDDIRKHERFHFKEQLRKEEEEQERILKQKREEKFKINLGVIEDSINDFSVHKWEILDYD